MFRNWCIYKSDFVFYHFDIFQVFEFKISQRIHGSKFSCIKIRILVERTHKIKLCAKCASNKLGAVTVHVDRYLLSVGAVLRTKAC